MLLNTTFRSFRVYFWDFFPTTFLEIAENYENWWATGALQQP